MACITPFVMNVTDKKTGLTRPVLVPCGKCEGCLKKKQSDWIARLFVESYMSLSSYFITLTYDENHLPFPEGVNVVDVQNFFKSFRKHFSKEQKFTYFLVSEYGAISSRPHYHFLLFCRFKFDWIMLSNIIEQVWKKGQHKIGTVDMASISYCAKYCLKSKNDPRHFYDNKTFALVSKRPAIGYDLLSLKKDFRSRDCFEVVSGNSVVAMPRYYRDKIFTKVQKLRYAQKIQEKYRDRPDTLTSADRYNKRVSFDRKQSQM